MCLFYTSTSRYIYILWYAEVSSTVVVHFDIDELESRGYIV
jgi:hypothetical protein